MQAVLAMPWCPLAGKQKIKLLTWDYFHQKTLSQELVPLGCQNNLYVPLLFTLLQAIQENSGSPSVFCTKKANIREREKEGLLQNQRQNWGWSLATFEPAECQDGALPQHSTFSSQPSPSPDEKPYYWCPWAAALYNAVLPPHPWDIINNNNNK